MQGANIKLTVGHKLSHTSSLSAFFRNIENNFKNETACQRINITCKISLITSMIPDWLNNFVFLVYIVEHFFGGGGDSH